MSFAERAQMMLKAAAILEKDKEDFAKVMTTEMGKTFRSAVDEAAKCAWVCRYYAENAETIPGRRNGGNGREAKLYPLPAAGRGAGGDAMEFSVLAGVAIRGAGVDGRKCGAAEARFNRAASALLIEDLFRRAGFPEGAFQTLLIGSREVDRVLGILA